MNRLNRRLGLVVAILVTAAWILPGCGGLARPAVTKRHFTIQTAARPVGQRPATRDAVLLVRRVSVSPLYMGKGLVYRTLSGEFVSDFYNAYFASPADMLTQSLVRWMQDAGLFAHVVIPSSLAVPRYALEGNVVSLYGDFASGKAVVEMQFFLIDEQSADYAILFSADYVRETAMATQNPQGMVAALGAGVESIFTELQGDLTRTLPQL